MKRRISIGAICCLATILGVANSWAADLEAFEFNDPAGTALAGAVNSVNAANVWMEDPEMAPSDVRSGSYNIVKQSSILESSFFQTANITSGTRYLVARMSGWNFLNFDAANPEEFRVAFLNDDDADFGSTITAQMTIRRNAGGGIELAADSLGTGSTVIAGVAPLATNRATPFTIALELNKTANSYKVFYKDNTSATQVLGLGSVAPSRSGNSVRLGVNNNFGDGSDDYPLDFQEVFSVDRIAVSDTNPFSDLITLDVDRSSGAMTLKNTSGVPLTGLQSYTITSSAGAFDPAKWNTVAGHYDSAGNGSVDNAPWAVTSSTKTTLAEAFQSGDGGGLANNQNVVLSVVAGGAWVQSPFEDVDMVLNFAGGVSRTVNVNFVGNSGVKWVVGDLNFDTAITEADYSTLITNMESDLSGFTRVEAYRRGDLDGDGANTIADFVQFKTLYTALHGVGSFDAMLANIPEPGSVLLVGTALGLVSCSARRKRPNNSSISYSDSAIRGVSHMSPLVRFALVLAILAATSTYGTKLRAAILEDFPFSDSNGTTLDAAQNIINASNSWLLHANTVESTVQNGSFRIQKQSQTGQASNALEIANITSGKAWLVAEFAGWSYTATASSPSERIRFAFLDNDPAAAGTSTVTAEANIDRSGSGLALRGEALGTESSNIAGSFALSLTRTTPFHIALELDKTTDHYSIYYKDNTAAYELLGTGNLGLSGLNPGDRDGNSIRFAFTGTYGEAGEFVDISRIYLTNTSPITGPVTPVTLKLEVKSNGQVAIVNSTSNAISLDAYRITSASNALNFSGWQSLSDRNPLLTPFDGPDPGTTAGDGIGETWDEAGGSDDGALSESFLLSSTTMAVNDSLALGNAFKSGGAHDLMFEYHDIASGAFAVGAIEYVTVAGVAGDYNNNGIVDAADYTVWRDHLGQTFQLQNEGSGQSPGTVTIDDYNFWKTRFGQTTGAGSEAAAVPEPAAVGVVCLLIVGWYSSRSDRRKESL